MTSRSPEARRAATPLLQNLGADDAVPLLLAALDDPDPGVRQAAFATLRAFSHRDHGDSAEAWRAWWRSANRGR
ncbi:MAG: HEAT repeat domain-containing protein [Minicystis sp.]